MDIKKTCIIKNKILIVGLSHMYATDITHNNGIDYDVAYQYKIFVLDMVLDKYDVSGNPIQGFDAILSNFETLECVHKSGLTEHDFEKMFNLDWNILEYKFN
tara:strand:- start:170 stop:475 length:306 start_codon:yes stop_codon:yes gene_type:complete